MGGGSLRDSTYQDHVMLTHYYIGEARVLFEVPFWGSFGRGLGRRCPCKRFLVSLLLASMK